MTPIEKNVIVVDEQGNEYEATYPKRARGLVKNGRARFVDENKICLACPPDKNLEDNKMENTNINEQAIQSTETKVSKDITMHDLLEKISQVTEENLYLQMAISALDKLQPSPLSDSCSPAEDIGSKAKAEAIADVVRCRETTNQQLLRLYEKMYDSIQNKKVNLISRAFEQNMAFINDSDLQSEDKHEALGYVTNKITELVALILTDREN